MQKSQKSIDLTKASQFSQDLLGQVVDFANGSERSQWLKNPLGALYVRASYRLIGDELMKALDIASITLAEKYRGQGIGTRLIEDIHTHQPRLITYVECVHNPGLKSYLYRSGWTRDELYPDFNFFKLKK